MAFFLPETRVNSGLWAFFLNNNPNLSTKKRIYPPLSHPIPHFVPTFVMIISPQKPKPMNKGQIVDAIASEAKVTKADAQRALDAFMTVTTKALKKGDKVTLVGFGTFSVSKRAARTGRNPQTGKEIKIAAKKVAKFKAGTELSSKVK